MLVLTFSILDQKHYFWANLVNEAQFLSLLPYVSRDLCEYRQLSSAWLFYFVAVSASVDCFCGLIIKLLLIT